MAFRFDEQQDEHPKHEQEEEEDDLALDVLFLVARCLQEN